MQRTVWFGILERVLKLDGIFSEKISKMLVPMRSRSCVVSFQLGVYLTNYLSKRGKVDASLLHYRIRLICLVAKDMWKMGFLRATFVKILILFFHGSLNLPFPFFSPS